MMKINNIMAKSSFLFACIVFLFVVTIGVLNKVAVNTLFIRAAIFAAAASVVSLFVFWIIGNSVEEEIIVMKEREKEAEKRRKEELARQEAEREENPEHYI